MSPNPWDPDPLTGRRPNIGRRPLLEMEWTERIPGPKDLVRLNAMWAGIDYDAPVLTEAGVFEVWRKPIVDLWVAIAMLHVLGWPSRWRAIPDIYDFEAELCEEDWRYRRLSMDDCERLALDAQRWVPSNPLVLTAVEPWRVRPLQGWSRAIDKLLPPAGERPVQGRRRFGKRRGVKRLRAHNTLAI